MNVDEDALAELADALAADPGYATGRRPFPGTVTREQAADLALLLCREVDRGAAAREAQAERQGLPLACKRGCNGCCEEPVMAYLPEAWAVARWLLREENATARQAFLQRYPAWREAAGDGIEELAGLLGRGDKAGYLRVHQAQWRKRVLCAFNQDGDCTVYPVRPTSCRNAHAVETHECCSGANVQGPPAARLAYPPLDRYLPAAEQVLAAAHQAVAAMEGRGDRRPLALCEAVYRLLAAQGA